MTKSKNKAVKGQVVHYVDKEANGYEWLEELPYNQQSKVKDIIKSIQDKHSQDIIDLKLEYDRKLDELQKTLKTNITALNNKVDTLIRELAKVGEA